MPVGKTADTQTALLLSSDLSIIGLATDGPSICQSTGDWLEHHCWCDSPTRGLQFAEQRVKMALFTLEQAVWLLLPFSIVYGV